MNYLPDSWGSVSVKELKLRQSTFLVLIHQSHYHIINELDA